MPITFTKANQPDLLAIAAGLTQSTGYMQDAVAFGAKVDGDLASVAVFQNVTPQGAEFHYGALTRSAARRDVLYGFHRIAFDLLKVERLVAPIAAWNVAAQIQALKSGFFICGITSHGPIDGSDAILMVLLKDAYRWMPHTQPQPAETAA